MQTTLSVKTSPPLTPLVTHESSGTDPNSNFSGDILFTPLGTALQGLTSPATHSSQVGKIPPFSPTEVNPNTIQSHYRNGEESPDDSTSAHLYGPYGGTPLATPQHHVQSRGKVNPTILTGGHTSGPSGGANINGSLLKRKDFLSVDETARSHPNRTYFYKRFHDVDAVINSCNRMLDKKNPTGTSSGTELPSNLSVAGVLFYRGCAYLKKGSLDSAINDLSAVLELQPRHQEALYHRGLALFKRGEAEPAIADLSLLLHLNPDHVGAAFARAACYNKVGLLTQAIEDYNLALFKDTSISGQGQSSTNGALGKGEMDPMLRTISSRNNTLGASSTPIPTLHRTFSFGSSVNSNQNVLSNADGPSEVLYSQWYGDSSSASAYESGRVRANSFDTVNSGYSSIARSITGLQHNGVSRPTTPQRLGRNRNSSDSIDSSSGVSRGPVSLSSYLVSSRQSSPLRKQEFVNSPSNSLVPSVSPDGGGNNFGSPESYKSLTSVSQLSNSNVKVLNNIEPHYSTVDTVQISVPTSTIDPSQESLQTADWHHAQGLELRRQGDFSGAVAAYSRCLTLVPRHFKALINRGFACDKLGDSSSAISDYTTALEVDPSSAIAYFNRGIAWDHSGDGQAALRDFQAAVELAPTNVDFRLNHALLARKIGEMTTAIESYTEIIRLTELSEYAGGAENKSRHLLRALFSRSACLETVGDIEGATRDLESARAISPGHLPTLMALATLHEKSGKVNEALVVLSRVFELSAHCGHTITPALLAQRAKLFMRTGAVPDAANDLDAAIAIIESHIPSPPPAHLPWTGPIPNVAVDAPRWTSSSPEVICYQQRALCRRQIGDWSGSLSDAAVVLRFVPDDSAIVTLAASVLTKQGDLHAAIAAISYLWSLLENNSSGDQSGPLVEDRLKVVVQRAFLLAQVGNLPAAMLDYDRMIQLASSVGWITTTAEPLGKSWTVANAPDAMVSLLSNALRNRTILAGRLQSPHPPVQQPTTLPIVAPQPMPQIVAQPIPQDVSLNNAERLSISESTKRSTSVPRISIPTPNPTTSSSVSSQPEITTPHVTFGTTEICRYSQYSEVTEIDSSSSGRPSPLPIQAPLCNSHPPSQQQHPPRIAIRPPTTPSGAVPVVPVSSSQFLANLGASQGGNAPIGPPPIVRPNFLRQPIASSAVNMEGSSVSRVQTAGAFLSTLGTNMAPRIRTPAPP